MQSYRFINVESPNRLVAICKDYKIVRGLHAVTELNESFLTSDYYSDHLFPKVESVIRDTRTKLRIEVCPSYRGKGEISSSKPTEILAILRRAYVIDPAQL
jgi:hypothetical protein